MPVAFDWEFQEEDPDPSHRPERGLGRFAGGRRWSSWLVLMVALIVVGGPVFGLWAKRQLDAAEKIDEELRAVVELELKTIAGGDVDLFRGLQDPNDARWLGRQIARYISRPQSLVPVPGMTVDERPTEVAAVRTYGELGEVELVQWFTTSEEGQGDPLPFRTTWFYRQDQEGVWHHVAPPKDYSGVPYSWYGTRLIIRASEFESQLLDPIAVDLVRLIYQGCLRLNCEADTKYTLSFEGVLTPKVQDDWWTLPELQVAGLPDSEWARSEWERALKLWMVDALARAQSDEANLSERVVYRQLLERLQADLVSGGRISECIDPDLEVLAEALRNGVSLDLQTLWRAALDPDDYEATRLREHAVAAMLEWIEGKIDGDGLHKLVPALGRYPRLDSALAATFELAPADLEHEWFAHLVELTDVDIVSASLARTASEALVTPSLPRLTATPGDQLAFVCNNVLWVGNADGSGLMAFTPTDLQFSNVRWSPDGESLLTVWRHSFDASALYLIDADGGTNRLLTKDPTLSVSPVGWSPDGDQIVFTTWRVFYPWRSTSAGGRNSEVWSVSGATGEMQNLPGLPTWSPDGAKLVYFADEPSGASASAWLADADWGNAVEIARGVRAGPAGIWSPDSSKVALSVSDDGASSHRVVVYDLDDGSMGRLVTAGRLTEAVLSSSDEWTIGDVDKDVLRQFPFQLLLPLGWSSDGSRLIVWAQGATQGPAVRGTSAYVMVPLDGSEIKVLAEGVNVLYGRPAWSPTDSDQLAFSWVTDGGGVEFPAYLFDLQRGAIYTATNNLGGAWSPDGRWFGFAGGDGVSIVDQEGQTRSTLKPGELCSDIVWNPAADLSGLGNPVSFSLVSKTDDWRFTNLRLRHDSFARTLYAWGEVVNESGEERRIIAFVPVLRDHNDELVSVERWMFSGGYADVISEVSLAPGQGLPFGFRASLPVGTRLHDGAEIIVHVAADPAHPDRDDLDIPENGFDLSRSDRLLVSGIIENPGPSLEEELRVVVTAYDDEGRVMGWGWRTETDPAKLAAQSQTFDVTVQFPKPVADLDLDVGSYKIQLFAH
jgi:Tol biopolymer transport system component